MAITESNLRMKSETITYLMLKYGSQDAIIDKYCNFTSAELMHEENALLEEYVEWYISNNTRIDNK